MQISWTGLKVPVPESNSLINRLAQVSEHSGKNPSREERGQKTLISNKKKRGKGGGEGYRATSKSVGKRGHLQKLKKCNL